MLLPSPEITWFLVGIVFLVVEMVMPGFVVFFFGLGAFVTALVTFLFSPTLNVQLVLFVVTSLMTLFTLRKYVQKTFLGTKLGETEVETVLASTGENATVIETINPPAEGKIKYSGTTWRAVSDMPIEKGEIVTIVSQNGLIMKVTEKQAA